VLVGRRVGVAPAVRAVVAVLAGLAHFLGLGALLAGFLLLDLAPGLICQILVVVKTRAQLVLDGDSWVFNE